MGQSGGHRSLAPLEFLNRWRSWLRRSSTPSHCNTNAIRFIIIIIINLLFSLISIIIFNFVQFLNFVVFFSRFLFSMLSTLFYYPAV